MARIFDNYDNGSSDTESGQDLTSLKVSAYGTDSIDLPSSDFAQNADFLRDGQDLVLQTNDGSEFTVEGYFNTDPAPTLNTPDGHTLTQNLVDSFVQSPGYGEYAQAGTLIDASPIGAIEEMSGHGTITRADGSTSDLSIGTAIYEGDIIQTSADGAAQITFVDESTFAVSENAKVALDRFQFDDGSDSGATDFSVLRGVFMYTSGLIGRDDPDDVHINTPQGSIGIRGTTIAGNVDTGEITVLEGAIVLRAFDGSEITLSNQFETGRFNSQSGGVEHYGTKNSAQFQTDFQSIKQVSGSIFNSFDAGDDGSDNGNGEGSNASDGNTDTPVDIDAQGEEGGDEASDSTGEGTGEGSLDAGQQGEGESGDSSQGNSKSKGRGQGRGDSNEGEEGGVDGQSAADQAGSDEASSDGGEASTGDTTVTADAGTQAVDLGQVFQAKFLIYFGKLFGNASLVAQGQALLAQALGQTSNSSNTSNSYDSRSDSNDSDNNDSNDSHDDTVNPDVYNTDTNRGTDKDDDLSTIKDGEVINLLKGDDIVDIEHDNTKIDGGKGSDTINILGGEGNTVWGREDSDVVTVDGNENIIHTNAGDDIIKYFGGDNNIIWSGEGEDDIYLTNDSSNGNIIHGQVKDAAWQDGEHDTIHLENGGTWDFGGLGSGYEFEIDSVEEIYALNSAADTINLHLNSAKMGNMIITTDLSDAVNVDITNWGTLYTYDGGNGGTLIITSDNDATATFSLGAAEATVTSGGELVAYYDKGGNSLDGKAFTGNNAQISLLDGNDTVNIQGTGNHVYGGSGNDTINLANTAGVNIIDAGTGTGDKINFTANAAAWEVGAIDSGRATEIGNAELVTISNGTTATDINLFLDATFLGTTFTAGVEDTFNVDVTALDLVSGDYTLSFDAGSGEATLFNTQANKGITIDNNGGDINVSHTSLPIFISMNGDELNFLQQSVTPIEVSVYGFSAINAIGGDTFIFTGDDNTVNLGSGNNDVTMTGNNNDIIGESGEDSITVEGDNNYITLHGGNDAARIVGNNNTIQGGTGEDSIDIYGSNLLVEGNADHDDFYIAHQVGLDNENIQINGGVGDDITHITTNFVEDIAFDGGAGKDRIFIESSGDYTFGDTTSGDQFSLDSVERLESNADNTTLNINLGGQFLDDFESGANFVVYDTLASDGSSYETTVNLNFEGINDTFDLTTSEDTGRTIYRFEGESVLAEDVEVSLKDAESSLNVDLGSGNSVLKVDKDTDMEHIDSLNGGAGENDILVIDGGSGGSVDFTNLSSLTGFETIDLNGNDVYLTLDQVLALTGSSEDGQRLTITNSGTGGNLYIFDTVNGDNITDLSKDYDYNNIDDHIDGAISTNDNAGEGTNDIEFSDGSVLALDTSVGSPFSVLIDNAVA